MRTNLGFGVSLFPVTRSDPPLRTRAIAASSTTNAPTVTATTSLGRRRMPILLATTPTAWDPSARDAPEPEDAEQERREEDLDADDDERRGEDREALLGELPEAAVDPRHEDHRTDGEAGEDDGAAQEQAVLEMEARAHPVEPGVLLVHEVGAVCVGAQPERDDLDADDHQQRARDHRVEVPLAAEDLDLAEDERSDDHA